MGSIIRFWIIPLSAVVLSSCTLIDLEPGIPPEQLQRGIIVQQGTELQCLYDMVFWLGRGDPEPWTRLHILMLCTLNLSIIAGIGGTLVSSASWRTKTVVTTMLLLTLVGICLAVLPGVRYKTGRWLIGLPPDSIPIEDTVARVRKLDAGPFVSKKAPSADDQGSFLANNTQERIMYARKVEGIWYHEIIEPGQHVFLYWPPLDTKAPKSLIYVASSNGRQSNSDRWYVFLIIPRASYETVPKGVAKDALDYRLEIDRSGLVALRTFNLRPLH